MEVVREHYRPKALNEAKTEMNRMMNGLRKRLDKRVATFPEGEYVLVTRCMTRDNRTGLMKHHMRAVGSGLLGDAVEHYWNELGEYYPEEEREEEPGEDDDARAHAFLEMPRSALLRATQLRDMLRELWVLEGHSKTKQIYKAVARGEAGFPWWRAEFPDIPFTNKAVESSVNSVRIYRVVAPKLYEKIVGAAPTVDAPAEPFVRCEKNHHVTGMPQCSMKKNHRGVCNMRYVPPVVIEADEEPIEETTEEATEETTTTDSLEFYTYLKRMGHKKEPFMEFTSGQIKQLGVHLKAGHTHLAAYRLMGLTVPRRYEKWYKKNNGSALWVDIGRKFPKYLDDHALNPQEIIAPLPPRPVRKPTRKRRAPAPLPRRRTSHRKDSIAKQRNNNEAAGYVMY